MYILYKSIAHLFRSPWLEELSLKKKWNNFKQICFQSFKKIKITLTETLTSKAQTNVLILINESYAAMKYLRKTNQLDEEEKSNSLIRTPYQKRT